MTVTVYIWNNSSSDVGHVSIQVGETYMSFWPKNAANAKNDIKLGMAQDAVFPASYKVDQRLEGRPANESVVLKGLDEAVMLQFWNEFKKDPKKYNMLKSNCSTVVASILELGSSMTPNHTPGIKITDYVANRYMRGFLRLKFLGDHIKMWTPTDVKLYALQIKSQYPG